MPRRTRFRPLFSLFLGIFAFGGPADVATAQCASGWRLGEGPPTPAGFLAATVTWDPDGSGPRHPGLVAGGEFSLAGTAAVSNIAFWDGTAWRALGDGFDGKVTALCVHRGQLIAGGEFAHSGSNPMLRIARWNGVKWEPMGNGLNGPVSAMTVYRDDLVVVGPFAVVGLAATSIVRWDGENWHAMFPPSSIQNYGRAKTAAVVSDQLFVGGMFELMTSVGWARNIAQFNGEKWSPVGSGYVSQIEQLVNFRNELIARAESFGGAEANLYKLARWDGQSWKALGSGFGYRTNTVCVFNNELVAGGPSTSSVYRGMGIWDGTSWRAFSPTIYSDISYLTVFEGRLLANGQFYWPGISFTGALVRWDGRTWRPFSSGLDGGVRALLPLDDSLVFGGSIACAGGAIASGIASWNGETWTTYAPPPTAPTDQRRWISASATALAELDGRLVAAGSFRYVRDPQSFGVVQKIGEQWVALGGSFDQMPGALVVHRGELFVGGQFGSIDGANAANVARWDGATWQRVGDLNYNGYGLVNALASYNEDLYVGGSISPPPGDSQVSLARWDGAKWNVPGGGVNGDVTALMVDGDGLIVGGYFTSAGGKPANCIARWDGKQWSTFGAGTNAAIWAMTKYEGRLYVGGEFTFAGSQPASHVAVWDGTDWQPLGSGLEYFPSSYGGVYAISAFRGDLVVGGYFATAGGQISRSWARWGVTGPLPLISLQPEGQMARVGERVQLRVEADAASALGFQWRKNGTPFADDAHIGGTTGDTLTIDPVGLGDQGTYDVVVSGACGSTTSERAPLRVFASVPGQPALTPAQPASAN